MLHNSFSRQRTLTTDCPKLWVGRPVVRTYGRAGERSVYGHVIAKFSRMGSLPHFFTHGASLRAPRARELCYKFKDCVRRQCGRVVRVPDLKSGDLEFKSHPDYQLDLFQVAPGSTPRLRLFIVNCSAYYQ